MKYLIIRQQEAEGCDYSIGCGIAIEWFETEQRDPRSDLKQIEDHVAYPDGEDEYCAVDPDRDLCLAKAWAIPAGNIQEIDIQKLQEIHCGREEDRKRADYADAMADGLEYALKQNVEAHTSTERR